MAGPSVIRQSKTILARSLGDFALAKKNLQNMPKNRRSHHACINCRPAIRNAAYAILSAARVNVGCHENCHESD